MTRFSLAFGAGSAVVALAAVQVIQMTQLGSLGWLFVAAPLATAVIGSLYWRRLESGRGTEPMLVALKATVLSHFAAFWFYVVLRWLCFISTGRCKGSAGGPPIDPLMGLLSAALGGVLSLLLTGWATVPLCMGLAWFISRLQTKRK